MGDPSEFAIDLARLQQLGEYHLPRLAGQHLEAANALADVEYLKAGLFVAPVSGESGMMSPAYAEWLELYSLAQSVLSTTVTNLTDIGDGVLKTVEHFLDQDGNNATRIEVESEMDGFANGPEGSPKEGEGPPPPHPGEPPALNDVPDDEQIYDSYPDS
jgi:hypothetical protein